MINHRRRTTADVRFFYPRNDNAQSARDRDAGRVEVYGWRDDHVYANGVIVYPRLGDAKAAAVFLFNLNARDSDDGCRRKRKHFYILQSRPNPGCRSSQSSLALIALLC